MEALDHPIMAIAVGVGTARMKLVESNVPTTLNTSAGAGRLEVTLRVGDYRYRLPSCAAGPG
ncbi:MAG: hypothetical protein ACRDPD_30345, partial [Streptosporangiaceae bacterium]